MDLCPALGLTIPVGKDSMSMRTAWKDGEQDKAITAPLSLVISAFTPVTDVRKTVTPQLMPILDSELLLIDLGAGKNRLGASILSQTYEQLGGDVADLDSPKQFKAFFEAIQQLLESDAIQAYHDRSDGGVFTTLCEMAFAGHCGVSIQADSLGDDLLAGLFNEELGAVIQVAAANKDAVISLFNGAGLGDCVHAIATLNSNDTITIDHNGQRCFEQPRAQLQAMWSETSYHMQSLRDNPECAEQEFQSIVQANPGLSANLSFDVNDDISAPYLNKGTRPKVAVLREQGVNGHVEMAAAFDRAGFEATDVHMSDILAGRISLDAFKGLVACGGFSYGDVLGAGEGWAKTILFNAIARDQFTAFFERNDAFSLGVCNGCQMMSNLKSLIPGTDHWPHFGRNQSEQFEARFSLVKIEETPSIMLAGMAGSHLPVAIAHGEGRAEFSSDTAANTCDTSGLVSLRYVDNSIQPTQQYPANPNGSTAAIASVTSSDGRSTIMMPHPERVYRAVANSWKPAEWQEDGAWLRLFRNARVFVD